MGVNDIPTLAQMLAMSRRMGPRMAFELSPSQLNITDVSLFGASHGANGRIGGGDGYAELWTPEDADTVVSTPAELASFVSGASADDIAYVADGARINVTALMAAGSNFEITASGVKIVGGRGREGVVPGVIYNLNRDAFASTADATFLVSADDVEFAGLRLFGPDWGRDWTYHKWSSFGDGLYDYYANYNVHDGIRSNANNTRIHNCEIAGWSWGGASFASLTSSATTGNVVEYSMIHHCHHIGLGYGVRISTARVTARYNYFNYTRHAIAATGDIEEQYEFTNNVHGLYPATHVIDMHGQTGGDAGPWGSGIIANSNTIFARGPGVQSNTAPIIAHFRGDDPQVGDFEFQLNYSPNSPSGSASYVNDASVAPGENYWSNGKVDGL